LFSDLASVAQERDDAPRDVRVLCIAHWLVGPPNVLGERRGALFLPRPSQPSG
jgi:hypothetical protein